MPTETSAAPTAPENLPAQVPNTYLSDERSVANIAIRTSLHRGLKAKAAAEGLKLKEMVEPVLELLLDPLTEAAVKALQTNRAAALAAAFLASEV